MTLDIKNFYLCTPFKKYEYLRKKIDEIPEDVMEDYNLQAKATTDGFVYVGNIASCWTKPCNCAATLFQWTNLGTADAYVRGLWYSSPVIADVQCVIEV